MISLVQLERLEINSILVATGANHVRTEGYHEKMKRRVY